MMIEAPLTLKALQALVANATAPEMSEEDFDLLQQTMNVSWSSRSAWILHSGGCVGARRLLASGAYEYTPCGIESVHALALLAFLCVTIVAIVCAFAFIREDKEEHITPLCPQMIVKGPDLVFAFPLSPQVDRMSVMDGCSQQPVCKMALDWPDPFRPGSSGVAATVRLQCMQGTTLATVVARNVAVVGQGLALCRSGCEIFGFVEPEGPQRYVVRHRTGVHLLTLVGDFAKMDIEGINPVGSQVCWFKMCDGEVRGRVLQHVDAGLVFCSLLATHVHRRLTSGSSPNVGGERRAPKEAPAGKHRSTPESLGGRADDAEEAPEAPVRAPHERDERRPSVGSCTGPRAASEDRDRGAEAADP